MKKVDYIICGSGLTGAVIARSLADEGRDVLVVERRDHIGGNVHDHAHESGIRIHTYGPHYFRTNSEKIWEFANRFGKFFKYEPALLSYVNGQYVNWPLAGSYIRKIFGSNWFPAFSGQPSNFEEAALSLMPREIYDTFVKEYNEKQWGVPAATLSAELCKRFDVRHDDDPRLKPDALYQGIPEKGYADWMKKMLAGIPVVLNYDYLANRQGMQARKCLVFTGPIDAFFSFDLGPLQYRGQKREHHYLPETAGFHQPCGQVNNPTHAGGRHIRTLEWKHMMQEAHATRIHGTVITREVPFSPDDPNDFEYPFPDTGNAQLYEKYRKRADSLSGVIICGRLGEYRYYDMDQAIGRAINLAAKIIKI